MVFVKKQPGDSNDSIIRKFQKLFSQDDIMYQIKRREHGGKPSAMRKFRRELARKMARHLQYKSAN